jgi:hypothetical protein
MLNLANSNVTMTCDEHCLASVGFTSGVLVRDLWAHQDMGMLNGLSVAMGGNVTSAIFKISAPSASVGKNIRSALLPE